MFMIKTQLLVTFLSSFVCAFHLQQQMETQRRMVPHKEAATMMREPAHALSEYLAGKFNVASFAGKFNFKLWREI